MSANELEHNKRMARTQNHLVELRLCKTQHRLATLRNYSRHPKRKIIDDKRNQHIKLDAETWIGWHNPRLRPIRCDLPCVGSAKLAGAHLSSVAPGWTCSSCCGWTLPKGNRHNRSTNIDILVVVWGDNNDDNNLRVDTPRSLLVLFALQTLRGGQFFELADDDKWLLWLIGMIELLDGPILSWIRGLEFVLFVVLILSTMLMSLWSGARWGLLTSLMASLGVAVAGR